jgi:hypothetical protein
MVVRPDNLSMPNIRMPLDPVSTASHQVHLVIHLMNRIDRPPNQVRRVWAQRISRQRGKLIIDNKRNKVMPLNSKDRDRDMVNILLNMVYRHTLLKRFSISSKAVRDLVVMVMDLRLVKVKVKDRVRWIVSPSRWAG